MEDEKLSFRPFLVATLFLIIVGWAGLLLLLNFSLPTLWPRWGLYFFVILGTTGVTMPISYLWNKVFSKTTGIKPGVVVRESLGVGVYFAILTWLSIGRAMNLPIAIWLALGLVVIEYLLRLRESSKKSEDVTPRSTLS